MNKRMKVSLIFLIILFSVGLSIFAIKRLVAKKRINSNVVSDITLPYWGLFYPEKIMSPLLRQYEADHPGIKIVYTKRSFDNLANYKRHLKTRLREGNGPAIFRTHSSWITEFMPEISFSNTSMDNVAFDDRFYGVTRSQCVTKSNKVLCVPLMYDGMVLLYNIDMFAEDNITPPVTWEDLSTVASKLTRREGGRLVRGGIAIGTGQNVVLSPDIFDLMLKQSNVKVPDALDSDAAIAAYRFYTDFATLRRVWNTEMPKSTTSFAMQKVAMIFARGVEINEVLELNPTLNFGVLPVPQLPKLEGGTTQNNHASFWTETVSNDLSEKEQAAAWAFLEWLSRPQQQKLLNEEYSKSLKVPQVGSAKVLFDGYSNVFAKAILSTTKNASASLLSDNVGNDEYTNLFKEAFDRKARGQSSADRGALVNIRDEFKKVLSKRFK